MYTQFNDPVLYNVEDEVKEVISYFQARIDQGLLWQEVLLVAIRVHLILEKHPELVTSEFVHTIREMVKATKLTLYVEGGSVHAFFQSLVGLKVLSSNPVPKHISDLLG